MTGKFLQLLLVNSCVSEIPGRGTKITDGVNLRNEKKPHPTSESLVAYADYLTR